MERYRTTLILVGVLIVLGGLLLWLNSRSNNTNSNTTDTGSTTPTATAYVWQEPNPVIGIDVVSGTQKVSLTKDVTATVWYLTAPITGTADVFSVGSVADSLKDLAASGTITDSSDLSQFKLDKPQFTVTAAFSNTTHTLQIGAATFDGANYYVKQPNDKTVYTVSNATLEPLRSWLDTPPKAQPTPTPLPLTVVPTSPVTSTVTVTGTTTVAPPAGGPTEPVTGTTTISGTSTITTSPPGAANPTTPVATPPLTATP